jgi:hypothetical protein
MIPQESEDFFIHRISGFSPISLFCPKKGREAFFEAFESGMTDTKNGHGHVFYEITLS